MRKRQRSHQEAIHLLLKKILSGLLGIVEQGTATEQFGASKWQIILILPALGNTTTNFDYTTLINGIARVGCFGSWPEKAVLDAGN